MKNYIRFIILAAVILLSVTAMIAQTRDVLSLKNGSVIKGTILEMIPDKTVKIQTADGNIFVYNMTEVDKISKEAAPAPETKPAVDQRPNAEVSRSTEPQRAPEGQQSSEGLGPKFSVYGGVQLPLGEFAKKMDESPNAGGAKLGWSAGIQFVTGGTIGLIIDGNYSQNKLDVPTSMIPYPGKYSVTGWSQILALAGIKIGTDNATGSNFFIAPLAGAIFATSPQIDFTPNGTSTSHVYVQSGKGTAFAYGGAVQIFFGKNITLGAKYIGSKPKFKYSMNGKDYESDPQSVSFLLASLGFAF
jgi:hypothetical protein